VRGSSLALAALLLAAAADARPARVVSMNPCVDAVLLKVADPGQIAGISHWSHAADSASAPLEVARRFPAHGGTAEEVIALRPDLVFVTPFTPLATRTAFARLGIATVSVGVPATIGESLAQVGQIAGAVGKPARGTELVAEVERALAATRRPVKRPALMRMAGGFVPGPGSLSESLMAHAGLESLAAGYGLKGAGRIGLEPLLLDPPPLIVTDEPAALSPLLARQGVKVARFERRLLNCGGPSLAPAARQLAAIRDSLP
jgi:iron complex transport system substrate-binding protein